MSMSHKAYAFDWDAFQRDDLPRLLDRALATEDLAPLAAYIKRNRENLKDPYEGDPLADDWQNHLENRDVHEYGDFALTRFYDPAEDCGLGHCWNRIDRAIEEEDRDILLGLCLGPEHKRFDPGRYGSYFQPPGQVAQSLARLRGLDLSWLEERDKVLFRSFDGLLEECVDGGLGLYVTF